jgi:hypothetical protein
MMAEKRKNKTWTMTTTRKKVLEPAAAAEGGRRVAVLGERDSTPAVPLATAAVLFGSGTQTPVGRRPAVWMQRRPSGSAYMPSHNGDVRGPKRVSESETSPGHGSGTVPAARRAVAGHP